MTNKQYKQKIIGRFDTVGSFLRPPQLLKARQQYRADLIDYHQLRAVEDQAIIDLIKKQEQAGLKTVSDGEFRRTWWHYDFFWGLGGIDKFDATTGLIAPEDNDSSQSIPKLTGKLSGKNHSFIQDYQFTQQHAAKTVTVKQTIPAPAQLIRELVREQNLAATFAVYQTLQDLIAGIAAAYHEVILDFYAAGARLIQLDDPSWGNIIGELKPDLSPAALAEETAKREQLQDLFLRANQAVLTDLPADLTVTTHVCRGNFHSQSFVSGGYESIAEAIFQKQQFAGYYLEYDNERSGSFVPLAKVGADTAVILGLVTTKTGELEQRETIIKRIHEAARYVALDQIYISPQCGFASTESGNAITEAQQWAKIALLKSVAAEVWGEE